MKKLIYIFPVFITFLACRYLSLDPETANPLDYPPTITTMIDTAVKINETVTLHAEASDPDGVVESFEWAFFQNDSWHATERGEYRVIWGISDTGVCTIRVRAVDNEGVYSTTESIAVTVKLCAPLLERVADMMVKQHDTVSIVLKAVDTNAGGAVERYYYRIGSDHWVDSSATGDSFRITNSSGGQVKVIWGARDNDGVLITDTFAVLFNRVPVSPEVTSPKSEADAEWVSTDGDKGTGSVRIVFSAVDPDNDELTYSLFLGKDTAQLKEVYHGRETSFTAGSLDTTSTYYWRLMATDPLEQVAITRGTFRTGKINPISKDGLVAWYPFNGNAKDESGNGNDGTVYGATLVSDRFGKPQSGYFFDGSSYINCGSSKKLNINEHSIVAWIKMDQYSAGVIIGKVVPLKYETIILDVRPEGNFGSSFATGAEINHVIRSKNIFELNKWINVALTYDGTQVKLYLNGVCDTSVSRTGIVRTSTSNMAIGRHGGDTDQKGSDVFFNGAIDDIRIYNRALSAAEIQTLHHEGGYVPPLDTPKLLYSGGDSTSISVKWNRIANATSYILESVVAETGPFSQIYSGADTTYTHSGLLKNQRVWYRVKASNATQISQWSNKVTGVAMNLVSQVYGDFAVTSDVYSYVADWDSIVTEMTGGIYKVADWKDVQAFYNGGGDMVEFLDALDFQYKSESFVKRDGGQFYSSSRAYYISRHDHNRPGDYLAHENIDNFLVSLGSWTGSRPILLIKN